MTNNVIKFPKKRTETIEIEDANVLNRKALDFAYEMLDYIHDRVHEKTGDCIFTDDEYTPIVICTAEVISAMYLQSQGVGHSFQEIAQELFGDVDIDVEFDYSEHMNIDEQPNEDE